MKIGYMKIGRSWKLDPTKGTTTGGDADVARALHLLSRLRPDDEFHLLGRNCGTVPEEAMYPQNVFNPWTELGPKRKKAFSEGVSKEGTGMSLAGIEFVNGWYRENVIPMFDDMDAVIVWSGQHGTSNTPIPQVTDRSMTTKPQDSFTLYAGFIVEGINRWRDQDHKREEIWLCPDPRNYLKARDLKWPLRHPIIAQFEQTRQTKFERYGDGAPGLGFPGKWDPKSEDQVWTAPTKYAYSALEMTALPSPQSITPNDTHEGRLTFGMLVNENRAYVAENRVNAMRDWVMPFWPDAEIFGNWSKKSMEELGRDDIRPCPYEFLGPVLQRWRSTFTTPASGSGWATAKPWECFAYGTVCFFHPKYDSQNHILKDASKELQDWLRVKTPEELRAKVKTMDENPATWRAVVLEQHNYFVHKYNETTGGVRDIMERLNA